MRFTGVLAVLVLAAGLARSDDAKQEKAKEEKALLQIAAIKKACQAYYINPSSGNVYPKKLADLTKPPWGGSSFLNDDKELCDPWGKEFKYATNPGGKPFVWSERT